MDVRLRSTASFVVTVLALSLAGCSALEHSRGKCHKVPETPGVVHTGGTYAVPRVLDVPSGGLYLSDAVAASLRPGILLQPGAPAPQPPEGSVLPVTQQDFPVPDGIKAALAFNLSDGVDAAGTKRLEAAIQNILIFAGPEIPAENVGAFSQAAMDALLSAAGEGAFQPVAAADEQAMTRKRELKTRLMKQILGLIAIGGLLTAPAPTDEQLRVAQDRIADSFKIPANDRDGKKAVLQKLETARTRGVFRRQGAEKLAGIQQLVQPPETIAAAAPTPIVTSGGAARVENLVVVVTRRSGRVLIIPLQSVVTYILGDIALLDGDRVEVLAFSETAASRKPEEAAHALVAVTSWNAAEGIVASLGAGNPTLRQLISELGEQPSDVVIVRHLTANGLLQEYILPTADKHRLAETYLQSGDLVHFDVLGLMPLIQNGRSLREPAPAAGPSCNLDTACKQLTGVSSADVNRQMSRAFQDANRMVLGAP